MLAIRKYLAVAMPVLASLLFQTNCNAAPGGARHSANSEGDASTKGVTGRGPASANSNAATGREGTREFGEALLLRMTGANPEFEKSQKNAHAVFHKASETVFNLRNSKLTEAEWTILGAQTAVLKLDLFASNLNDERFLKLRKLTNLRELNVSKTLLTDKGLAALKYFPAMEKLSVEGIYLSDDVMKIIASMKRLTELHLSDTALSETGIASLEKLTKLKRLNTSQMDLSEKSCKSIAKLKQLEHLNLQNTSLTDKKIQLFAPLTALVELRVRDNELTDDGLDTIVKFTRLVDLDLGNNKSIDDDGIKKLVVLKGLHTLGFARARVTNNVLNTVAELPKLEILGMRATNIDDSNLKALAKLKKLNRIFTIGTKISARGRQYLRTQFPKIEVVY